MKKEPTPGSFFIEELSDLPGLKEANKKQTKDEFLNGLKQAQQVYAQNVCHPRSATSISDPLKKVNKKHQCGLRAEDSNCPSWFKPSLMLMGA